MIEYRNSWEENEENYFSLKKNVFSSTLLKYINLIS